MSELSIYDLPTFDADISDVSSLLAQSNSRCLIRPPEKIDYRKLTKSISNLDPLDCDVREERLFDFYRDGYETFPLSVSVIDGVEMFCPLMIGFRSGSLLRETIPPWRRQNMRFYEKLKAYTDCTNIVEIEGPACVLANYSHTNYWHWVTQCLSNLLLIRWLGLEENITYILPSGLKSYHRESLALMGVRSEKILEIDASRALVKKLIYPSFLEEHSNGKFSPLILDVFSSMAARTLVASPSSLQQNVGKVLYLTRRDTDARTALNEDELIEALVKKGVHPVTCSDYSVDQQVSLAAGASGIIGMHGAALTNVGFSNRLAPVLEIMPRKWGVSCFYSLTSMRRQPHFLHVESNVDDPALGHKMKIRLDVPAIVGSVGKVFPYL